MLIKLTDYNSPMRYKPCRKKQYDIHVCMPPEGTIVFNKLEQADIVKYLNGKDYFTLSDLDKLKREDSNKLSIIMQAVSNGEAYQVSKQIPFVLGGTKGELWGIAPNSLAEKYFFLVNNQPITISQQTLNQRMSNGVLNWTVVRTKPSNIPYFACFVPVNQKGQIKTSYGSNLDLNGSCTSHGKGDFVVCSSLPNGLPNLNDRWVVNGEIFAQTYNNQGWQDCLSKNSVTVNTVNINDLPNLIENVISEDYTEEFNKFCDEFSLKMSTIVEVLEAKDFKNGNKMLKVTGDNDNSLVLRFTLHNDTVIIQGKSDKINYNKKFSVKIDSVSEAVADVLNILRVSPLRMRIRKLNDFINSNTEYNCSRINFKSSKYGFIFNFIINKEILFTYSVDLSSNNCFMLYCKRSDNKSLPYNFSKGFNFDEKEIYNQINEVFTQEKSSWRGTFNELVNMFKELNNKVSFLVNNKGDGVYYFSLKDKSLSRFDLKSYDDTEFVFNYSKMNKQVGELLRLPRNASKEKISDLIDRFMYDINKKKKVVDTAKQNYTVFEKVCKSYDDLIWSNSTRNKLSEYENESVNANTLNRLFLCLADLTDCRVYTTESRLWDLPDTKRVGFSFDDEVWLNACVDDNGEYILFSDGRELQTIYEGALDISDIDILLGHIVQADFDVPRQFREVYDYDFSKDFWFSMDNIYAVLEDTLAEIQAKGYISEDTYYILDELCKAKNSRVNIPDLKILLSERDVNKDIHDSIRPENVAKVLAMFSDDDY